MATPGTGLDHAARACIGSVSDLSLQEEADRDAIHIARKQLEDDIQKCIAAHRHKQPPPFSHAELIVMAIINHDSKHGDIEFATFGNILRWILDTFPFYKNIVTSQLLDSICSKWGMMDTDALACMELIDKHFTKAFSDYSTPLIEGAYEDGVDCDEGAWTVDVTDARSYLRKWIEPQQKHGGAFRFLDPPAELRNRVYQMLLVFAEPAVRVESSWPRPLRLKVHGRVYEKSNGNLCAPWECHPDCESGGWFRLDSLRRVLDFGLTCKQISSEAIPVFYGCNTFAFGNAKALEDFVRFTPKHHLRHVKRMHLRHGISTDLCLGAEGRLHTAIEAIGRVAALDEITIDISIWARVHKFCDTSCAHTNPQTLADVPSLSALATLFSKAKNSKVTEVARENPDRPQNLRNILNELISEAELANKQKSLPPQVEEVESFEEVEGFEEDEGDKVEDLETVEEVQATPEPQGTQERISHEEMQDDPEVEESQKVQVMKEVEEEQKDENSEEDNPNQSGHSEEQSGKHRRSCAVQ